MADHLVNTAMTRNVPCSWTYGVYLRVYSLLVRGSGLSSGALLGNRIPRLPSATNVTASMSSISWICIRMRLGTRLRTQASTIGIAMSGGLTRPQWRPSHSDGSTRTMVHPVSWPILTPSTN